MKKYLILVLILLSNFAYSQVNLCQEGYDEATKTFEEGVASLQKGLSQNRQINYEFSEDRGGFGANYSKVCFEMYPIVNQSLNDAIQSFLASLDILEDTAKYCNHAAQGQLEKFFNQITEVGKYAVNEDNLSKQQQVIRCTGVKSE
ncbi:hypothetical protein ABMA70_01295 [Halobacteriovorax sp. XZX-3]|uniref:hypothetical protein n=1 Tax=unclassified Halobacteriovorax TaxID=2639665 RepID=UPI003721258C